MSDEQRKVGPYEIGERVAKDPSGRSYASTDPDSGRPVTIKVLEVDLGDHPKAEELFDEALETAADIKHPSVLNILDRGQDGNENYLVMEELPGATLHEVLKSRPLKIQDAFRVFRKIAAGVEAAHEKGIIQGDLSPRTIAVSENLSVVKLTDLGVPREGALTGNSQTMTSTSAGAGTLHYTAPEVARSQGEATPRSDIYSLGVLFYQLLTGNVPFGKFNLPSRVKSEIPPEVDPVVLRCLEADPAERFSSVEALLRDVGKLEDKLQLGLVNELQGIGQSIRNPTTALVRHARGIGIAVGAVVIVGAIGFGIWKWSSRPQAPALEQPVATGTPIELTFADPLESRPSESLAVAIDAVDPPQIEELSGDEAGSGSSTSQSADAGSSQPAPQPSAPSQRASQSATERGRDEYEVAAEKARNELFEQAVSDLDRILASNPSLAVEADALSLRAGIEESQGRTDDAMATYSEIGTRFGGRKLQVWARYNFGRLLLESDRSNRLEAALDVFDEVARVWPNSEYAADALASKAVTETALKLRVEDSVTGKRVPAAFLTSRTLVERYPTDPAAEQAYWLLGQQYEDLKEWQLAADAYWQLGTGFPGTRHDAWWKAGQMYDRRLDDKETAVRAYQQVPQSSSHYADAQKRITRLSR